LKNKTAKLKTLKYEFLFKKNNAPSIRKYVAYANHKKKFDFKHNILPFHVSYIVGTLYFMV
jgi:hypothetical protein